MKKTKKKPEELKAGDTVVLCRHEEYGMGQAYLCLGKVVEIDNELLINIISDDYSTKDIDNFLENVELCCVVWKTFNPKKDYNSGVFKIEDSKLEKKILSKQTKEIDKEIKKLVEHKKRLVDFYKNEHWK